MEEKFEISVLGLLAYYLGIEVTQTDGDISIKQSAYANKILKEAGMLDCNETLIPMDPGTRLTKVTEGTMVNSTEYRHLIRCLRYLLHTRPELSYSVGLLTTTAATQALWLKRLLIKLTHSEEEKVTIKVDNKSTIALMKNLVFHGRSKHIDTKSKEDDVSRISTSIFITNFPDSFSAKDLFHSCKQCRHVVDTFILSKRSKARKGFRFVCFINVFNVERLVNNLCTVWVDQFKFHANIARFHRAPLNGNKFQEKKDVGINRSGTDVPSKDVGVTGTGKSYVHVVKGNNMFGIMECDSILAIVLDDECLYSKDLSKSLLGRVKEFASLSNLKTALMNEVGELLDVDDQEEMCFHLKRLCLYTKFGMNIFENFKVIFRGKVFWIHAKEIPGWVPDFLDDSDDEDQSDDGFKDGDPKVQDVDSCGDDSDVAEVPEMLFEESTGQKKNQSKDPFGIYLLPNKKDKPRNEKYSDHRLKYPSGFTPNDDTNEFCMNEENIRSVNDDNPQNCNVDEVQTGQEGNSANKGSKVDVSESVCSVHFKKSEASRTGGLILCLLEELVKVGQTMRYNMDGCVNNMTEMVESQGAATTLDRYLSDHRPILLRETQSDYRSVPFRFFHHWTELEGFNKFVIDTWSEAPGDDSNAMRSMMRKLKYLKVNIREWNTGNMNNTKRAIAKYKEELKALDAAIDKAMDMAQKAKIKWSIEWGENSRFFHRFDKPTVSRAYVNMSYSKSITINQQMDLEHDVFKEKLKRAVWDCGTDKSPGPDGFTFGFYRHFWSTIENDVFEAVKHFFTYGDIPKGCNSSFIALILKIPNSNLVKDFRPISLIGSIYKIIAKILENRLVSVLGDIVNERVVDAGMFMGIKLSPSPNISHMFYADDAVFVGQWCDGNINTLVYVLECFYRASGLRINMSKSKIMGFHVKDEKEVVDKVKSRLSNWKMKALSIGGRLTLLKSVLGSMPIFHMSIFRVPLSVLHMLEPIRSHFFNGHKVIKAIYGDDGKVGKVKKVGIQSCWMNIVNEISVLKNQGVNVFDFMQLKLGNGNTTAFWEDNWIGGNVLKDLYPRIYALETCKWVTVSKKLTDSSLDNSFRRKTRGGVEHVQYNALSDMVHAVTLVPLSDRWVWSLKSSGEFSMASVRKVIDEKRLSNVNTMTRWIKCVPIKVNVLAWKIKIDALPTRLNSSRRGVMIIGYPVGFKRNPNPPKQSGNNNKSLMLTVGHPNVTLAKIATIGSLRLTGGIVLYKVFVVSGYNTWSSCDQVMTILGKKIGVFKNDHISSYDTCHKAKQTRKPFPLSDHKSIFVGDIIHCNVWGPYRVVRRKAIGCIWIWKIKYKSSTEIDRYKARLVAKGYSQKEVTMNKEHECDQFKRFLGSRKSCLELLNDYGLLAYKPVATTLQQNVMLSHEETDNDKFLSNIKKQATSFRSSAESEYRCLASTTCKHIWVVKFLKDLEVNGLLPAYGANSVFHKKTKCFEIDLHLVREKVSSGIVKVMKVPSVNNIADIFTKGLSIAQHNEFVKNLG
nr:RNA-directed DNA polymerase, eukaryota, reverse transcriptase zinc-binding domain protein [Tanacetum cinerariifolium]